MNDWFGKTGDLLSSDRKMGFHMYAKRCGIPKATLGNYCHPDPSRRTELGAHAGKPSLLSKEEQGFVVDVLRRRDRANDGMNPREAANTMQVIVV